MTIAELETTFGDITANLLNITTPGMIRVDWPTQGQPGFNVEDDVIFIKVVPVDDDYNRVRDMAWAPTDSTGVTLAETYSYTRVIGVTWVCYGPNSNANAQVLRNKIFYEDATDLLDSYGLYLVTDIAEPQRAPEEFNNLWWERTDLALKFNYLEQDIANQKSIASVPLNINGNDYTIE